MKKIVLFLVATIALSANSFANITITNWGSDSLVEGLSDWNSATLSSSSLTLVGIEGSNYFGDLCSTVPITDIAPVLQLQVTGVYTGNYTGEFSITLLDSQDANSRTYTGSFSDFTRNVSSVVTATFVGGSGDFNNVVQQVGFFASGSGELSADIVLTSQP